MLKKNPVHLGDDKIKFLHRRIDILFGLISLTFLHRFTKFARVLPVKSHLNSGLKAYLPGIPRDHANPGGRLQARPLQPDRQEKGCH